MPQLHLAVNDVSLNGGFWLFPRELYKVFENEPDVRRFAVWVRIVGLTGWKKPWKSRGLTLDRGEILLTVSDLVFLSKDAVVDVASAPCPEVLQEQEIAHREARRGYSWQGLRGRRMERILRQTTAGRRPSGRHPPRHPNRHPRRHPPRHP